MPSSDERQLQNIIQRTANYVRSRSLYEYLRSPRTLYAVAGIFLMWTAASHFESLVCNAIGFLYPAYKSVKAIESVDKDDDTEWLMYWVVFAAFSVCEFFSDIFLSWFPFYFLAKCIFLLWCMAPSRYNGSAVIYYRIIRPFILRNEGTIDEALDAVSRKAKRLAKASAKEAAENVDSDEDLKSD